MLEQEMERKRETGEDLADKRTVKSLKAHSVVETFKTMELAEQQAFLPELLKIGRIVNGYALNHVSPDFIRWVCSGNVKQWSEGDVERGWEMWNFLYRRTRGETMFMDDGYYQCYIWGAGEVYPGGEKPEFHDGRNAPSYPCDSLVEIISRESFFNIILKEFQPNLVRIQIEGTPVQNFESYMQRKLAYMGQHEEDSELTYDYLEHEQVGFVRDLVPDPRLDPISYPTIQVSNQ